MMSKFEADYGHAPFICHCEVCTTTTFLTGHTLGCACRTCQLVSYEIRIALDTGHAPGCTCDVCLDAAWMVSEEAKATGLTRQEYEAARASSN